MKLDLAKDLLQKETPTNKWLIKDTDAKIIRAKSKDIKLPLSVENELIMKKLIDFVRYSQDPSINEKDNGDYLRPAVGLAAPQIGANINMFFIRFEEEDSSEEYAIINGRIISKSVQIITIESGEGCLSVDKDYVGFVPRSYKIEFEGFDWLTKKNIKKTFSGYHSIVFQHELDHINGKLYYDWINKKAPEEINHDWIYI
ncbi:peptide deformylase [Spiroplasma endosymbiont of Labia minor]|uniref:peptide deformylase n=1 Tax=Spiroplasma endosymbiont of Labia minor TaxID=3066305 RepID=UPI0030D10A22